jgi:hypothetical protein
LTILSSNDAIVIYRILDYLFILANAFIGVFIFLFFIFRPNVKMLYKNLFIKHNSIDNVNNKIKEMNLDEFNKNVSKDINLNNIQIELDAKTNETYDLNTKKIFFITSEMTSTGFSSDLNYLNNSTDKQINV